MFFADLHIHSTFSDGRRSIPEIVDLYGTRGFGAIAITDHLCDSGTLVGKARRALNKSLNTGTFPLYMEILRTEAKRAMDQYGMLVIPGIELTQGSMVNHTTIRLLALGVQEYISADQDALALAKEVRQKGGLVVAAYTPHLWERRAELGPYIDAWEAAAGNRVFDQVLTTKLPKFASSGMHSPRRLIHRGAWMNVLFCERTQEAVFAAIRKQEVQLAHWRDGNRLINPGNAGLRTSAPNSVQSNEEGIQA